MQVQTLSANHGAPELFDDKSATDPAVKGNGDTTTYTPPPPKSGATIQIHAPETVPKDFKGTVVYHHSLGDPQPPKSTKDMTVKPVLHVDGAEVSKIPKDFKGDVVIDLGPDEPAPKVPENANVRYSGMRWTKDGPVPVNIETVKNPDGNEYKSEFLTPDKKLDAALKRLDTITKDGKLSKEEAGKDPLLGGAQFNKMDLDNDKFVEASEINKLAKLFRDADDNGNKKLDDKELAKSPFKGMDLSEAQKDGAVSYNEIYDRIAGTRKKPGKNAVRVAEQIIAKLDKGEKDGKLDKSEVQGMATWTQMFDKLDVDPKDGKVGVEELAWAIDPLFPTPPNQKEEVGPGEETPTA